MAALTRAAPTEQERKSHEMGMHTEQLSGRTQQVFFDIDLSEHIDRKVLRFMGDAAAFAYISMQQAIADAGLEESDISNVRTGIIAGSGGASSASQVEAADTEHGVARQHLSDVSGRLDEPEVEHLSPALHAAGHELRNMETGAPLSDIRDRVFSANAYIGMEPIPKMGDIVAIEFLLPGNVIPVVVDAQFIWRNGVRKSPMICP